MELDEFGREIPFGSDPSEKWRYQNQQMHSSYNSERKPASWKTPRKSFPDEHRRMTGGRERSWSPDIQRSERRRDRKERGTNSDPFKDDSPLLKYAQEPLLCQKLWQDHKNILDIHLNGKTSLPSAIVSIEAPSRKSTGRDELVKEKGRVTTDIARSPSYPQYAHNYCLKYTQAFFDNHNEESWFRELYSPLGYKRMTLKFLDMARNEAVYMMQEMTELGTVFVVNARLGSGIKTNVGPLAASGRELNIAKKRTHDDFVGKPSALAIPSLSSSDRLNTIPLTHVHHALKNKAVLKIEQVPSYVSDLQILRALNELTTNLENSTIEVISSPVVNGLFGISAILASHMNPWLSGLTSVPTRENTTSTSPSDEIAISNNAALLAAWTTASAHDKNNVSETFLYRTCWALLPTMDFKDKLLQTLSKINDDMDDHLDDPHRNYHLSATRDTSHKVLKLFIDCSDPYGRFEVDADGHGGNTSNENGKPTDRSTIAQRKCTVLVCNDATSPQQISISVLSAAISSSKRIQKDKESAIFIARAMDVLRRIPEGARIDDLISKVLQLQSSSSSIATDESRISMKQQSEQDVLDVTIAYLRRVHFLSFYNRCKLTDNFGAALGTHHPLGTIYLRLKGADEILEKMDENNESGYKKPDTLDQSKSRSNYDGVDPQMDTDTDQDMLVRLLDQSIKRALDCSSSILTSGENHHILNETLDVVANEIGSIEEKVKVSWVHDHCSLDADGRARCTFHFCRKLFKDKAFLEKHLTKKHDAYLEAELSKCHDNYILKLWEQDTHRPIPPILVDCGTRFGLKPSVIRITDGRYTIDDPEPDLVRLADERIQMELQREADEIRRREYHFRFSEERRNRKPFSDNVSDGNANVEAFVSADHEANHSLPIKAGFIDVDDMKDEKVKLSFENIDVSKVVMKKKKKLL